MEKVSIKEDKHGLVIGDNPKLVLDLNKQEHYIEADGKRIPYHAYIELSPDLLEGKRENVLQTAVNYYYGKACKIVQGMEIAAKYREKANTMIREKV